MKKSIWQVKLNRGFGKDIIVEAESEDEAKKAALAEYRRNYGADGILDFKRVDDVIAELKPTQI